MGAVVDLDDCSRGLLLLPPHPPAEVAAPEDLLRFDALADPNGCFCATESKDRLCDAGGGHCGKDRVVAVVCETGF